MVGRPLYLENLQNRKKNFFCAKFLPFLRYIGRGQKQPQFTPQVRPNMPAMSPATQCAHVDYTLPTVLDYAGKCLY